MALPSNIQGKGLVDATLRDKYSIVGLGIADGMLKVERNVYEGGLDVESMLSGKYSVDIVPITKQVYGKMPAKSKLLIEQKLAEQGYSTDEIKKLVAGESLDVEGVLD